MATAVGSKLPGSRGMIDGEQRGAVTSVTVPEAMI